MFWLFPLSRTLQGWVSVLASAYYWNSYSPSETRERRVCFLTQELWKSCEKWYGQFETGVTVMLMQRDLFMEGRRQLAYHYTKQQDTSKTSPWVPNSPCVCDIIYHENKITIRFFVHLLLCFIVYTNEETQYRLSFLIVTDWYVVCLCRRGNAESDWCWWK